jgi:hypothetical protein
VSSVRFEPAEVWLNDGRPARFIWRGRMFAVLSVTERPDTEPGPQEPAAGGAGSRPAGAPDRWQCWRAAASPGLRIPPRTYWLCLDPQTGRWAVSLEAG